MNISLLVRKNWGYIVVLGLIVLLVTFMSVEGFTGDLADFPSIFVESVAKPYVTELKTSDVFASAFDPKPMMYAISQLNIEGQIKSVMVDIDGVTVKAPVHIPAQVVEKVEEQRVITYVEPKVTDVVVAAQVVQLPEQEGTIQAQVDDKGGYIEVPVTIPAQTVVVPEQNAVETRMEKFTAFR